MERIRYEIDPHNRLVSARTGKTSKVPKYRKVLDGRFRIDKKNFLVYHVKKSPDFESPQQIKLSGNWSLDRDHNLVLTLDKWGNQYAGNKLTIEGELLAADSDKLAFSVATKDSNGGTGIYILNLLGRWQAYKYNRLSFNIKREKDVTDKLTFQGGWEIDKQNQIIYTYTKSRLKTKEKSKNTITFKGHWDIGRKYRLSYILNREINSGFDFTAGLGRLIERGLRYEIEIGASPSKKILTLSGKWRVDKRTGLLFEMPYQKGKMRRISFGVSSKLDKNHNLDLKLKNSRGEDLGIEAKLSKKMLNGRGEAFIEGFASGKEISLIAGAGFIW